MITATHVTNQQWRTFQQFRWLVPKVIGRHFLTRYHAYRDMDSWVAVGEDALLYAAGRREVKPPRSDLSFQRYAAWIIRRRLIDFLRFRLRRPQVSLPDGQAAGLPADDERAPDLEVARTEGLQSVRELVGCLPPGQQRAVQLHYLDGLTFKQIGALSGRSASAACTMVTRGIQRLRSLLKSRPSLQADCAALIA